MVNATRVLLALDCLNSPLRGVLGEVKLRQAYTPLGFTSRPLFAIGFAGLSSGGTRSLCIAGNGARFYYSPVGRFITGDAFSPFGKGGLNSYAWCEGDPVNRSDPNGHAWVLGVGLAQALSNGFALASNTLSGSLSALRLLMQPQRSRLDRIGVMLAGGGAMLALGSRVAKLYGPTALLNASDLAMVPAYSMTMIGAVISNRQVILQALNLAAERVPAAVQRLRWPPAPVFNV
ncbi:MULTISPECIES: RHS repeat-associated core domain-containing protein [unclassified Pseudomonas]|uniref:RHS repeat-associated core domain-containing protein n=1 Tax=unclassified Pseudomonas TaxID=196821 RepID=UPI000BD83053|nr:MULTISPECIES: RHS repeat-associated core domain-containing protein [unclassified Pseudomonas]PVZ11420.1 RHS repeat-associated protein [Pseudomonas sp. URIL14HWK12:I12]PVZ22418.1 RHS repeat-associated protein [Pseudomonas sp. URIL14HWK12:I10]PVZ31458.1 RHS repeat-associated protein [Pseudomonas sp. URIL14HWK12:I11]SNZ16358.1 RHS repeat-associated core domain-containing protein [Pseudomonas sp. URIL14HWK12:I9]